MWVTYVTPRTRRLSPTNLFPDPGGVIERLALSTVLLLFESILILSLERPVAVLTTGAVIAVPVFYVAKVFRITTIFVESVCRTEKPSLTGQLLYPVADYFLVQWPSLAPRYGRKAQFRGRLL